MQLPATVPELMPFSPILRSVVSLEEAMDLETAASNMADTVEQVFRVIRAAGFVG